MSRLVVFLTVADWLTQVTKSGKELKQLIHTVYHAHYERIDFLLQCVFVQPRVMVQD